MKRVEVIQDDNMDITMFWIFEQKENEIRRLVGVNFHCGTDCIDDSYTKPNELLTELYCKLAKQSSRLKESILKDAVNEWMIITDVNTRQTIVDNEIEYMMEVLKERVNERAFCIAIECNEEQKQVEKFIKDSLSVYLMDYTKR